jgi:phosphoserine phosphatase
VNKREGDLLGVLHVARQLGATTDLDALLDVVVTEAARVLDAERSSLFLYDAATDELVTRVAMGTGTLRVSAGSGLVGTVARTRRMINVPDAYADARFNPEVDRRTGFRTRSILTAPLTDHDDGLVGVLQVLNKRDGAFNAEDEFIASVLGAQAGVALHRAQLMNEALQKKRMERDLDIARNIQQSLLPKGDPSVEGFDIAGWNRPANETGGDSYDFQVLGGGRLGVLVADAIGHGIGPALVISECRALVRALSAHSPGDVAATLERVSHLLEGDLPIGHFVTACLAIVDGPRGEVSYASAGQAPLYIYRAREKRLERRDADGLPLGLLEGPLDEAEKLRLDPGDVFLVLTDGFFEQASPSGEQLGLARLEEAIVHGASRSARELIESLRVAVEEFARGAPQDDDLTAVAIKRADAAAPR